LIVGLLLTLLALCFPTAAAAHDVDVTSIARIFLDQIGERRYVLSVVDSRVPPVVGLKGVLPAGCSPVSAEAAGVRLVAGFAFECDRALTFDDVITLPWQLAGVVALVRWSDGTRASALFRGDGRSVAVRLADLRAGAGSAGRLAGRYFVLGGEHILFGIDHLLFVLGLLLLLRGFWPLVKTITAFTIAHSITLGAAVLGYVPVDRAPVEAGIALSIVLLAREIVTGQRGDVHLVHRQPWLVAFIFGLLHGLGFAGALGEMGLRGSDVPPALLFFNLGVEAGQLTFVIALVALGRAWRLIVRDPRPRLEPAIGYALGGLATAWLFQRLPAVWGG
jgi:hydrogenase/urease accessory protein HupE